MMGMCNSLTDPTIVCQADNPRPLPRPWESYKWRNDVDDRIVAYLQDVCGMQLQKVSTGTQPAGSGWCILLTSSA